MPTSFKCCKKDFNNFVCVVCLGIFHPNPNCRRSAEITLEGYKIYCSAKCVEISKTENFTELHVAIADLNKTLEKKDILIDKIQNDFQEQIENLESTISKQYKDISDRDLHLDKMRKKSRDFTDEVEEAEQNYLKQLIEKREKITKMDKEIIGFTKRISQLEEELQNSAERTKQKELELIESQVLNKQMIATIRTLEADNSIYSNELCQLRKRLTSSGEFMEKLSDASNTGNKVIRKSQLLIIGDANVRGFISLFKKFTNRKFDINCQRLHKPTPSCILKHGSNLMKTLTKSDYVILFWGSQMAVSGKSIKDSHINELLNICKDTNLIVFGSPLFRNRPVLNRLIQEQNSSFCSKLKLKPENTANFVPVNFFTSNGILFYDEKTCLVQSICGDLLSHTCNSSSVSINGTSISNSEPCSLSGVSISSEKINFSLASIL
ncbi:unnamed protein product [Psylliodes chrysocephalus]|uniref:Uncharacterized protein n=1 Tax=Psylliodes chrysocephalus TaxID=3402493 RepID=A0A9P0CF43_9CUCU|nr:unnamed protein product [Psylliodes chrysocephala]